MPSAHLASHVQYSMGFHESVNSMIRKFSHKVTRLKQPITLQTQRQSIIFMKSYSRLVAPYILLKPSSWQSHVIRSFAHFKNHVIVRPPASAAELAELEEMAGPLPRDFTIFYATCNGVRVQLDTRDVDAHI